MVSKAVVSAISLILVVGVALAVVAFVHYKNGTKSVGENLSPSMKAMIDICGMTDHQEICQKSLSPVAEKGSMDPKEFIKAAIQSTINELSKSMNFTDNLVKNVSSSARLIKMGLDDCKELLQFAVEDLQSSFSMVDDNDLRNMNDIEKDADLKNWLSAVISFQENCRDEFQDAPEYQSLMTKNLQDASLHSDNALAIVCNLGDILNYFGLEFNIKPSGGRRLLSEDGYPSWLSASDIKLLALQDNGRIRPNVVVAKDGSGQFKSIGEAIATYPKNHRGRYVIYVKAGIYDEYIIVQRDQKHVFIYGDGARRTIVTGNKDYRNYKTQKSASFSVLGNRFMAKSMGFRNTAGPEGHQAVALRVQSDRAIFYYCRMDGYQDTLYVQAYRQFFRNCVISGTVDFIFGDSATVIQNSLIIVRKPMDSQFNTVTAQGRTRNNCTTGLVIHNCRIVPEQELSPLRFKIQTYLGRPWKEYARTVIMETTLADFINPAGYHAWDETNFALETCSYLEYANRGPGANTNRRVRWKGVRVINRREALQYTANYFIHAYYWLKGTGVPYLPTLRN